MSEITLDRLVEKITEAYCEVDRDMRIRAMNGNAERLLRTDRQRAIGQPLSAVIRDAERSQHWPALVEAVRSGTELSISVFYPAQYIWHEVTVVPSRTGAALLMRDVTDRQWLIRREAERVYLRNVFEDAPVAITLLRGARLVVEYTNAFARRLVGGRDLVGRSIREALPEIEQKELFNVIDSVYTTGVPFTGRDVFVRFDRNNDGQLEDGWFDISYQAVRDFDGTVSGVLSLSIDVTDRRRSA